MINEYSHGAVHELQLARPPANALDLNLILALSERLKALPLEGKRVAVISGSPGIFSGGLDISALLALGREDVWRFVRAFLELQYIVASLPIPTIMAITGHSAGGGTELMLYADYRVMARGAYRIGINEVQVGLCPGRATYGALRRLVGAGYADRLIATGDMMSAEQALTAGLVDALAESDDVIKKAVQYGESLAALPIKAYRSTRQLAREDLLKLLEGGIRKDACEELVASITSPEAQSALRARQEQMRQKKAVCGN
jgi:Delta3-Delta2-enoyl-CoA isomerase